MSEPLSDEEIAALPVYEARMEQQWGLHSVALPEHRRTVARLLATIAARDAAIEDLRGELRLRGNFLNGVAAEADESKARVHALEEALRQIMECVARCPICNAVLSNAHPYHEAHAPVCIMTSLSSPGRAEGGEA